ncbi:MAG: TrmH family RNA methyltransferase [Candidatus Muiribacteriota bacterium]
MITEEEKKHLLKFMTPQRLNKMLNVLENRSDYISVIAENFFNPGNVSALIRSIDALGFCKLNALEYNNKFSKNKQISRGSEKWVEVEKFNSTEDCFTKLKSEGRYIYYADPDPQYPDITEMPLDKPLALVFGQENPGVSEETKKLADGGFRLPIYGFVDSYNVSVTAALTLFTLRERLYKEVKNFMLDEKRKRIIFDNWIKDNYNVQEFVKTN